MIYSFLFEVIKIAVAGIAVVCVAFYLFKPYLENNEKFQLLELKKATGKETLPLRLQAYERVILLIDRINPANLIIRLNAASYTAAELHSLIVAEVRNEYQHNVTQQLYVSPRAWLLVKRVKDDTLNLTRNAMQALPEGAGGLDLGKTILSHLSKLENDPYDIATNLIRTEVEELF
jgi:hypothetical protein